MTMERITDARISELGWPTSRLTGIIREVGRRRGLGYDDTLHTLTLGDLTRAFRARSCSACGSWAARRSGRSSAGWERWAFLSHLSSVA